MIFHIGAKATPNSFMAKTMFDPNTYTAPFAQRMFFSETVVLSSADYPASARAKADLVCLAVDRALLEALIRSHPAFAAYFSRLLSERMRRLYASIRAEQDESFPGTCGLPLFSKKVGEIMTHPVNRLDELLPGNWQPFLDIDQLRQSRQMESVCDSASAAE